MSVITRDVKTITILTASWDSTAISASDITDGSFFP
jgi:hypothetical protein